MKSPAAESLPWSGSLPTYPKNHTTQQKDFPTKKTSKMYGYSNTVRVSEASLSGKEGMKKTSTGRNIFSPCFSAAEKPPNPMLIRNCTPFGMLFVFVSTDLRGSRVGAELEVEFQLQSRFKRHAWLLAGSVRVFELGSAWKTILSNRTQNHCHVDWEGSET